MSQKYVPSDCKYHIANLEEEKRLIIDLLHIDKQCFKQLKLNGITLKCFDCINECHQSLNNLSLLKN